MSNVANQPRRFLASAGLALLGVFTSTSHIILWSLDYARANQAGLCPDWLPFQPALDRKQTRHS